MRIEESISATVFIVDDDISVRESLESLISWGGWNAVAFESAQAFLDRTGFGEGPSCLVLDVSMPGIGGLDLQKLIADQQLGMPIIFITGHGDIPTSVRAMKAGAVEFLTKPIDDELLLDAIGNAIERSRASLEHDSEIESLVVKYSSLTPREQEVMTLVVSGLLNKQVAYQLGISEITVKAHRGRIMQKMMADSLADLVRMSISLQLTPAANPWQSAHSDE